jgi:altronate dehydratase large subunit
MSLTGYKRADGRWGFRNHVLIMPLHQMLSATARQIEAESNGAVAISHDWSQVIEKDHKRIIHSLAGNATNPNLYATILLRLGTPIEDEVIALAKSYGPTKLIEVSLTQAKSIDNLKQLAITQANELVTQAKNEKRVAAPISAIVLGLECGGSDAYSGITANPALGVASDKLVEQGATSILGETMEILGAEHLLAARAVSKEVGQQIIDVVARYEKSINYEGIDIRGAQPSRGNIEGGLSTLEEKSLGAAKKAGNAQFTGVLEYAIAPKKAGLYFMDTPGHDIEQLTGFGAAGVNITVFTTGRGTPTGSAVMPTIKVATNSEMANAIPDIIDLNSGTIADGTQSLEENGQLIYQLIIDVANGQLTKAELGGHHEFNLSRLYNSSL